MKIVIKISDEDYKAIAKGYLPFGAIADAIRNGTPLPKGHGRLIDADDFFQMFEELDMEPYNNAPTIIEADREE